MDTTYHSNIPVETLSLLDCDVRNFNFIHPIKNIFFDNIDYIRKLDTSNKARPCILDNIERSLLCHTCYLGFDQFECPLFVASRNTISILTNKSLADKLKEKKLSDT